MGGWAGGEGMGMRSWCGRVGVAEVEVDGVWIVPSIELMAQRHMGCEGGSGERWRI